MATITVYVYTPSQQPMTVEAMAANGIDEQFPYGSERFVELGLGGAGIQTVDTDPQPPSVTVTVLVSALDAADTVIGDETLDAAGLRDALVSLRAALG